MYTHPELARLLAESKIEEERSRARHVGALRASVRGDPRLVLTLRARRHKADAPTPAIVHRWPAEPANVTANAPTTTNG